MNTRIWNFAGLAMLAVVPATAQMQERRADIRGGSSGGGKCTFEVEVDGSAEVEFSRDLGRLRTVSGQTATWRRLLCTEPLPRDPVDFRFRGIDGRGRVQLIREPRSSGGRAVVRIDDPQGGREGYTFDLEWRGGGGDYRGGGGGDYRGGGVGGPGAGIGGGAFSNWDREVDFRGRGDGHFRNSRGTNDRLHDCEVRISRRGAVTVTFEAERRSRLNVSGQITRMTGNRIFADVSGSGIRGVMEIRIDGRDRVREVTMSAGGRERFELRWKD